MNNQRNAITLLGLAPLLGATDLLVKAIAIGLLGLIILPLCGLLLTALRRWVQGALAGLLLGGLLASATGLLLQTLSAELAAALALFLPLLALPCLGLALAPPGNAGAGIKPGLMFAALALVLGLLRESLGNATLFSHADWLLGPGASGWQLSFASPGGIHLLTLAPGAFILLGLLLAAARHFHHDDHS